MGKYFFIVSILGLLTFGACNPDRGDTGGDRQDGTPHQRDTAATGGEPDRSGGFDGGQDPAREDTLGFAPGTNNGIIEGMPADVSEKILADGSLRDKRLNSSRTFEEGGDVFYELSFDNGQKAIYDKRGNRMQDRQD